MGLCSSRVKGDRDLQRRFRERDRVEVKLSGDGESSDQWVTGTVVGLDVCHQTFTNGKQMPYQVKIDALPATAGGLVFAKEDSESCIRPAKGMDQMSVKELRKYIQQSGMSAADCIEKAELETRASEATDKLLVEAEEVSKESPAPWEHKFSAYDCILCEGRGRPDAQGYDLVVVCLHGLGATPKDFVPLRDMMNSLALNILWVLPAAPRPMIPMGPLNPPVWFKVDFIKIARQMQQGEEGMAKLLRERPDGLVQMREQMHKLLGEVCKYAKVEMQQVIMGGFSLGSMAAMDTVLSRKINEMGKGKGNATKEVGGVIMMGGAPIVVDEWHKFIKEHHPGLRVLISHGTQDSTLPYAASIWCRDLLVQDGANVKHISHDGGHEMGPIHVIQTIAQFLAETARLSGVNVQ